MDFTLFGLIPLIFGGTAQPFESPKTLVAAIYEPLQKGEDHENIERFYSARLKELVAENLRRTAVEPDGAPVDPDAAEVVSFNPFLAGAEGAVGNLVVSEPTVQGDQAVATVSFSNVDAPTMLSISMVRELDGWHVDDVASLNSDNTWLLSWLLQYDPFSEK